MRSLPEQKLFAHVRDVLLQIWDPIGVAEEPGVQDEYDSYIWPIVRLLRADTSIEVLSQHLDHIEIDLMGLSGDAVRAEAAARALVALPR